MHTGFKAQVEATAVEMETTDAKPDITDILEDEKENTSDEKSSDETEAGEAEANLCANPIEKDFTLFNDCFQPKTSAYSII